ncbi:hypothetical protein PO124_20215 [Bacillus licheniformis]|nr:hypothetical protein [Bacillus licheniformis]
MNITTRSALKRLKRIYVSGTGRKPELSGRHPGQGAFHEFGANQLARLVTGEISDLNIYPLKHSLKK